MSARADSGFTLLEALIATTIFAMLMGSLHSGLRNGWRAWGRTNGEEAALSLAKSLIAAEGVETPLAEGGRSGDRNGIAWRTSITPYAGGQAKGETVMSAYWVRADVSWRDRGFGFSQRSLTLTSLKLAQPQERARP